jgi:non-canonical purine NTP pyrophosphatase (RdgB/HAM1 family)
VQRIPVESTDIVSIGYDVKTRVLEIEFKEDRIYQYTDVAPDVYERFMRTDSYGEFFFAHINKHYRYKRVNGGGKKPPTAEKLAFVTGNPNKIRDMQEACKPFGIEIEQLDLPVEEIQSFETDKIALHKAKQAYKFAARPVVVQDTFWNILALRGFPGPYMRYINEWFKPEDFLALMQDKGDRTVIRTHTLAYYDGRRSKLFSKDFMGQIAEEPRGEGDAISRIVVTAGAGGTIAEVRNKTGLSSIPPEESVWHEFAKWYNLQRRLGKV